jgi:hypothetical protein
MSNYWQDPCGVVIQGPRPPAPKDVVINNGGVTRPGWFDGTLVRG